MSRCITDLLYYDCVPETNPIKIIAGMNKTTFRLDPVPTRLLMSYYMRLYLFYYTL